jgi:hypothetical protein
LRRKLGDDCRRAVARTIIDYDDFEVLERLPQNALDRLAYETPAIMHGHHDAYLRRIHQ